MPFSLDYTSNYTNSRNPAPDTRTQKIPAIWIKQKPIKDVIK